MADGKQSAIREIFEDTSAGRLDFLNARTIAYSVAGEMETVAKLTADAQERAKSTRGAERQRAALVAGVGLWIMRKYKEAAEALEPVTEDANGGYFRGLCLTETGDYAGAVRSFQRAADAGQDAFVCAMGQAEALRRAGNRAEALAKINQFQKSHDHEAELHYQRGRLIEEENYEEAIKAYDRAVSLNAQHAGALFRLGLWNDLRGNDDAALDCYEKAAAIRPVHTNVLVNLGVMYEDRGEYQKAAVIYERLLTVDPTNPCLRMYRKDAIAALDMYYDEATERRQHRTAALLRIPLSEFELSARSRAMLDKMNVRTLGDLARLTEQEINNSKNFGETSLSELRGLLESKNLHFGMGRPGASAGAALTSPDASSLLSQSISDLDLSVRSAKCVRSLGCETVNDLINRTEKDLLQCQNFGQTSLNEIKRKLESLGLSLKGRG